jgi:hypothetical protein
MRFFGFLIYKVMPAPKKYTPDKLRAIKKKLIAYIDKTSIPIAAEFAYLNNLPRQMLYEHDLISDTIKNKLIAKKEAQLEKLGLKDEINISMAIFSLKQLGWKDKQDVQQKNFNYDMTKMLADPKAEPYIQRLANGEDPEIVIIEYERTKNAEPANSGSGNT